MAVKPLLGTTEDRRDTATGGEGYARTKKAELFIAAVASLSGKGATGVDARTRQLIREVGLEDPAWILRLDRWLRDEANVRDTTIAIACEFVKARLDAGVRDETGDFPTPGVNRTAVNVACLRADEPAAVLEYWWTNFGRNVPMPVKRGVADAVRRLYNERSALKWDGTGQETRMGDVIELTHPKPKDDDQGALFEYLLSRRHGRKAVSFDRLPVIKAAMENRIDPELRARIIADPTLMREVGMTWENLSSLGPMDADAWGAAIPNMGYMALIRNLRNFDEADISEDAFTTVVERLTDADQVKRSRQFPFRFLSAYRNSARRWENALEQALELSLENIPTVTGRTLILVDCSQSMAYKLSDRTGLNRKDVASLFGVALSRRCDNATVVCYGDGSRQVAHTRSGVLETITNEFPWLGGTYTARTARSWHDSTGPYDRVVVLTDEGAADGAVGSVIPDDVFLYTWNVQGAAGVAHAKASPTRHTFAGLTDQAFRAIPLIEAGVREEWPF